MKKFILVVCMLSCIVGHADYTLVDNNALQSNHDWEHFGTSFACQQVMYGLSKRVLRMDRTDAVVFSLLATMVFTSLYSIANNPPSAAANRQIGHDILMNGIGAGLSAGATFFFEF